MPRPIFDKLAKMPVRKLDLMELEHNRHYETFTRFKDSKVGEIQNLDKRLEKLKEKAGRELDKSVPNALGTAMEMRHVKAEILISKSVLTVLRSNQFYHRLMMMLIQDTKAGVEYNQERIANLVPAEFSDIIRESVSTTNMEGLLGDLRADLDEQLEGDSK